MNKRKLKERRGDEWSFEVSHQNSVSGRIKGTEAKLSHADPFPHLSLETESLGQPPPWLRPHALTQH